MNLKIESGIKRPLFVPVTCQSRAERVDASKTPTVPSTIQPEKLSVRCIACNVRKGTTRPRWEPEGFHAGPD